MSAERIRHSVSNGPIHHIAGDVPVTLSLGFASVSADNQEDIDSESLIRAADSALYTAKANGRNRVEGASQSRIISR